MPFLLLVTSCCCDPLAAVAPLLPLPAPALSTPAGGGTLCIGMDDWLIHQPQCTHVFLFASFLARPSTDRGAAGEAEARLLDRTGLDIHKTPASHHKGSRRAHWPACLLPRSIDAACGLVCI